MSHDKEDISELEARQRHAENTFVIIVIDKTKREKVRSFITGLQVCPSLRVDKGL